MSKSLNEVRVKIDSIDNQLHDLLMERAALVSSVAAAKKKDGLQIVQPAREARMMRRLLARHEGVLPRSTIVRIWRELVGSVALLQTGLSVIVSPESQGWDAAKNYFGSVTPMKEAIDNGQAIAQVRDGGTSFAVLPFPDISDNSEKPWWSSLFDQSDDGKLSIICSLPYGNMTGNKMLVVSKIEFMPSGDDVSFVGITLSSEISRASMMDFAKASGLSINNVFSGSKNEIDDTRIYLLEAEGFIENDADSISALKESLGDQCLYCQSMGGYPVIPDIS